MATLEERVAAIENKLGMRSDLAPAPAPLPQVLRGWEPIPITAIGVGYSPELYALRPERYAGEPWGDRLVTRGDTAGASSYVYDPMAPAWVNFQAWERAGRPSRDSLGRPLDVRGAPLGQQPDFGPR